MNKRLSAMNNWLKVAIIALNQNGWRDNLTSLGYSIGFTPCNDGERDYFMGLVFDNMRLKQ